MKKLMKIGLTAALILSLTFIGACANIADDRTRTQTEGTLAGAGIGAVLGAAIGAATGGSRGALTGALIGVGVGGAAGWAYGTSVANKKADYASEEEWLAACLAEAQGVNQQTAAYNQRLKTSLAAYKKQGYGFSGDGQNEKSQAIKKELKESGEYLALLNQEITAQESAAASAADKAQAKNLQKQVDEMKKQKQLLEQNNQELAAISNRIAM